MERRLAAILLTDMVGYSRLMGLDEEGTIARQKAHREKIIDPGISNHGGRIVKTTGDGLLAEFPSVVDAVKCAVEMQEAFAERDTDVPEERRIEYRIGINLGDIVIDGEDILGDGVNVAARLEGLAKPGGVCISGTVHDHLAGKVDVVFKDAGEQTVKNVPRPVRVWHWHTGQAVRSSNDVSEPPALPYKPSIAVLPFDNMSGDREQDYFADGMVEDIITALSRLDELFVISRNSSFTYKGQSVDVRKVAREFGVHYVLEGSVRKAGGRVRITAQLIDGTNGAHLWADRFDGQIVDIFDLQDQITENVVAAIEPTLRKAEIKRARRKWPENLEAYDFYLRALPHAYAMRPQDNSEALFFLHKAIELDPEYAPALAYAAWCYEQRLTRGWQSVEDGDETASISLARRVLGTGSDDANALATAGFVLVKLGRDYDAGLSAVERALSLNPNTSPISMFAGFAYIFGGKPSLALSCFERAMRLSPSDPTSFLFLTGAAYAHLFSDSAEQALELARRSMALNPYWDNTLHVMAAAAVQLGRRADARSAVEKLLAFTPNATISLYREFLPFDPKENLEIVLQGLRVGGLPE